MNLAIANGENITIHGDSDVTKNNSSFDHIVEVEGANYYKSQQEMLPAYWVWRRSVEGLRKLAKKTVDSIGFNGPELSGIFEARDRVNAYFGAEVIVGDQFTQTDPSMTIAHFTFATTVVEVSGHAPFLVADYNAAPDSLKNSYYYKYIARYIPLCVGQPFPDFTMPMPDGKLLALKDVLTKGKVTVVQFWSDNSPFRKRMQDELLGLYKIYHDKGLNVVAFSSDKYEQEWKEAVNDYGKNYPWYNVRDPKAKAGMVETVYHEYGPEKAHNTTNVVIDGNGKILTWDVEGAELQYYIWKMCNK